ncbi:MAG: type II toxin-antitoxin system PemK/MazF family toxin [Candidatus Ozemobacteraceae bacterium]
MPLMTSFKRGDVVLAHVVFTDGTSTKKRPAIVVSGSKYHKEREEIIVLAVSSNTQRTLFGDIVLQEWQEAGLLYPSTATGIFFTIKKELVERRLGALTVADLTIVEKNLKEVFEIGGGRSEKKDKT